MRTIRRNTETGPRLRPGSGYLVGGAVGVLFALLAAAFFAGFGVVEYREGTAERAAQDYLEALRDEDPISARTHLAPELAAACATDEPRARYPWGHESIRFRETHVDGDRVRIELEMTTTDEIDPFELPLGDRAVRTRTGSLVLEQRTGTWLVVDGDAALISCTRR